MNMYGIMAPHAGEEELVRSTPRERLTEWLRSKRMFLLIVVLPALIVGGYLYLICADQYESESHFLVRAPGQQQMQVGGVGQLLGAAAGISTSQSEAMSVADYLTSHDVVAELGRRVGLKALFQRPEADVLSRLHGDQPTPERMLKYYLNHVTVYYNTETGITSLKVHAFRPDDALRINRALLDLGEERVNQMNLRSYDDSLKMARSQLADAEAAVAQVQSRITGYRQDRRDIDPQSTGEAQIRMVSTLQTQLAAARSQLAAMGSLINRSSPQYVALAARVRSLEAEVGAQSGKMTNGGSNIASTLGGYENLRVRQDFVGKRYDAAAANLEKAREEAQRQQLYVVRVVDPNLPVKSTYPQRARIMATMVLGLLLAYAIGWLIVAGVREHAA
ncbi:lipopolysaccharide biosynthesis protein [Sphingomonas sp.]|uniref:lipopolysaccharide biosynthesis protein n=1 Tax=Sphingomonas sp. TaxID=28214 RepID=UPI003AFFE717